MTCAICGTRNPEGSQVCAKCGEASWVLENGYAYSPDPEPVAAGPGELFATDEPAEPKRRGRRGNRK